MAQGTARRGTRPPPERRGLSRLRAQPAGARRSGANGNPILSNGLLAVIRVRDALSIPFGGIQNADDHTGVVETVKAAMGDAADPAQTTRLQRLIRQKNQIQYDHRTATIEQARAFMDQAERFAGWARESLARP